MSASVVQIVILAAIQGAAELLPVSSSAHVILAEKFMGLDPGSPEMVFLLVMLHTGTMFAVVTYFWQRWMGLMGSSHERSHFIVMILVATACTGFLGLTLKLVIERVVLAGLLGESRAEVEHLFRSLPLMAGSLFAAGVLTIVAGTVDRSRRSPPGSGPPASTLGAAAAVMIGSVQGLALPFRGFSRSGATISTGLLWGVRRSLAEDFSFALAVVLTPPVISYELRRLLKAGAQIRGADLPGAELVRLMWPGLLGMALSFTAGLVALRWLSGWLERGRWQYFGYYCVFMSAVLVVAYRAGF